jgi:hypothetical protein
LSPFTTAHAGIEEICSLLMNEPHGWEWFAGPVPADKDPGIADVPGGELAARFARCFAGNDGRAVLDHLHAITLHRALAPAASDQELRHIEGQRNLVIYISALVARGLRG